jgi:alkenylglycerophosphocholine/alkenylglycerophosphoethanolamine hydrolase
MKNLRLYLHVTFGLVALAHLATSHLLPYPGDFVIKAIPALCLAGLAAAYIPGRAGMLLCIGFILSAGGDVSLSFQSELNFMVGLGLFLLAHVAYTITFSMQKPYNWGKWWMALLLVGFGVFMAVLLFPKLGEMRPPVLVYLSVILCMGVFATLRPGPQAWTLIAGATLFMLSDSIIALNKFLTPVPYAHYYIMVTYYAGQYLICRAFLPAPVLSR